MTASTALSAGPGLTPHSVSFTAKLIHLFNSITQQRDHAHVVESLQSAVNYADKTWAKKINAIKFRKSNCIFITKQSHSYKIILILL